MRAHAQLTGPTASNKINAARQHSNGNGDCNNSPYRHCQIHMANMA